MTQALLGEASIIHIPAQPQIIVTEKLLYDAGVFQTDAAFQGVFFGKTEKAVEPSGFPVQTLQRDEVISTILASFGSESCAEILVSQFIAILHEYKGKRGSLLAFLRGRDRVLRAAYAHWRLVGSGWHVVTLRLDAPYKCYAGDRVASQVML